MAIGACGIACDVCRLHRQGLCSSCGGGATEIGIQKMAEQERILGAPCPVLACARLNRIDHCMADCDAFPCENFSSDNYPYGEGFLSMQKRRRNDLATSISTDQAIEIPHQHWQSLKEIDPHRLQRNADASLANDGHLHLVVLNREVRFDRDREVIEILSGSQWIAAPQFLSFVTIVYLINSTGFPLSGRWVTEKELSCANFFHGIHQLPVTRLINRFGETPQDLKDAATRLGGVTTNDGGDVAVRLWVFPRIPVKLILWCSDEVLPASLTVLFDHSIDKLLPADGIWALVNLTTDYLVHAAPAEHTTASM